MYSSLKGKGRKWTKIQETEGKRCDGNKDPRKRIEERKGRG